MSQSKNEQIMYDISRELWSRGDLSVIDRLFADDVVDHESGATGQAVKDGYKGLARRWHEAFPDLSEEIDVVVADDDVVAGRFIVRGTHLGYLGDIAPTGRAVEVKGIDMYRIRGGRVIELWYSEDVLGLLRQIGHGPDDPFS